MSVVQVAFVKVTTFHSAVEAAVRLTKFLLLIGAFLIAFYNLSFSTK